MNGHASFNEIFLTDARVPNDNVVGAPGEGWRVALTTLAHERQFRTVAPPRADDARRTGRARGARRSPTSTSRPIAGTRSARAVPTSSSTMARETGRGADPVVRQRVAALVALQRAHQWTVQRAHAGTGAGSAARTRRVARQARGECRRPRGGERPLAASWARPGLLTGADSLRDGVIAEVLVSVPAQSIAGGTDEIQRNIIGERVLGLPKEPGSDRDLPFREVARNSNIR